MVLWNNLAKKLCIETQKSSQDICQIINNKWRENESRALVKELGMTKTSTVTSTTLKRRASRLHNNVDEMEKVNTALVREKKKQ